MALRAGARSQARTLRNGAPFKDWMLPAGMERVRRKLAGADDSSQQMVDILTFEDTPINQTLVRDLAGGHFIAHQRNPVLVAGTGTGETHLAIAIAPEAGFAPAHAAASTTSSIPSIVSRPRPAMGGRVGLLIS